MSERKIDLPIVAANHKDNAVENIVGFLQGIAETAEKFPGTVIVCPIMLDVNDAGKIIKDHGMKIMLGAQDVSAYEVGARTGEISASLMTSRSVSFTIVGHSERRAMGDSDEILAEKFKRAKEAGLDVIYCVRGLDDPIPEGATIVAYEPVFAIGTGNPATPEHAAEIATAIKQKANCLVLYGGSVDGSNVKSFIGAGLDGVLVGGASLKAETLIPIIQNIV